MAWRQLHEYQDDRVPKLRHLAQAAEAGLTVPETRWLSADAIDTGLPGEAGVPVNPPEGFGPGPWMLRSGSAAEDGQTSSAAGRFLSLKVEGPAELSEAMLAVRTALIELGDGGHASDVLFLQPLIQGDEAGVLLTDGWWFESETAAGVNFGVTEGSLSPTKQGGHVGRSDPLSCFIGELRRALPHLERIDAEFVRQGEHYTLLQARAAHFPIKRDPVLSIANHREILGELPSPWMTASLESVSRPVMDFFAAVDGRVAQEEEGYSETIAGRPLMNFSVFFRMMDRWGLPRSFVTDGVGGGLPDDDPAHARPMVGRMLRNLPRLLHLQVKSLWSVLRIGAGFRDIDHAIAKARHGKLQDLFAVGAKTLGFAIRTNFAIGGLWSGMMRMRRFLRIRGHARVVTLDMMDDWALLQDLEGSGQELALNAWLERYGHRGPLESDLARPRFAELRQELLADLQAGRSQVQAATADAESGQRSAPFWTKPFFWIDVRRERFRHEHMLRFAKIRVELLKRAERAVGDGLLDSDGDLFLLRPEDFDQAEAWRERVAARKEERSLQLRMRLPTTAQASAFRRAAQSRDQTAQGTGPLHGHALTPKDFTGRVRTATALEELLGAGARDLGPDTVLVVPALEPSWALVFPRVGAVVAEVGGELSHASILLREAQRPALVDCAGVMDRVADGDRVRIVAASGELQILDAPRRGARSAGSPSDHGNSDDDPTA